MQDKYGIRQALDSLGIKDINPGVSTGMHSLEGKGDIIESYSPVDGRLIGKVTSTSEPEYHQVVEVASKAYKEWRKIPAPNRGEVVRLIGDELRKYKEPLGKLVSYEMGKSLQEGMGEVQEMIDICSFATGLSRQLNGSTMPSERPNHRMFEQYHPLGIVGIISAFNFPVAVWSWNSMLAWICGDVCIWKPSEKVPLCAVACQNIVSKVFKANDVPEGVSCVVNGDYRIGELLSQDKQVPLVSATGSIRMGKKVAATVSGRLGRPLMELGGNNAIIISEHADIDIAIRASIFGAVGTCGQRCTTTRRLIIHERIYNDFKSRMISAFKQLSIGNPLDESNHIGPLIDKNAVAIYSDAIEKIIEQGGSFAVEGGVLNGEGFDSGCYVKPAIAEVDVDIEIVKEETFAPILYMLKYHDFKEALEIQNGVTQGLSSAIMTNSMREQEYFLSAEGSDCGIANVNIGTSGAEIGGAFGGEKETGGGRESGSDAWKIYMRRQTNTINYGADLPLAQGIKFDI